MRQRTTCTMTAFQFNQQNSSLRPRCPRSNQVASKPTEYFAQLFSLHPHVRYRGMLRPALTFGIWTLYACDVRAGGLGNSWPPKTTGSQLDCPVSPLPEREILMCMWRFLIIRGPQTYPNMLGSLYRETPSSRALITRTRTPICRESYVVFWAPRKFGTEDGGATRPAQLAEPDRSRAGRGGWRTRELDQGLSKGSRVECNCV